VSKRGGITEFVQRKSSISFIFKKLDQEVLISKIGTSSFGPPYVTFHSSFPFIRCTTVIDSSYNCSWRLIGYDNLRYSRLIAHWSVKNIIPDVTPMLAEMFMLLDEDHDGVVDINELRDDMETVLKGETRTPEELMAETDTNGDAKPIGT
jgi:Ca2+-binding EF-hand superfamily protein